MKSRVIDGESISRQTPWLTLHVDNREIVKRLEEHNVPKGVVQRYDEIWSGCIPTEPLKYIDKDGNLWDWS